MHEASTSSEVARLLHSSASSHIAVDGTDGSGKSTLARELASALNLAVIHLDDFVARNLGAYIPNLDTAKLAEAVGRATNGWVLEGICILQALEAISVECDALVYVKKMSHGYWCDEDQLDPHVPVEEHLARLREMVRPIAEAFGESGHLGLAEEVIRYHVTYRPHAKASIAYLRTDG